MEVEQVEKQLLLQKKQVRLDELEDDLKKATEALAVLGQKVIAAVEAGNEKLEEKLNAREIIAREQQKELKEQVADVRKEVEALQIGANDYEKKKSAIPDFVYVQAEVAEQLIGDKLETLPALAQLTERLNRKIEPCYPVDLPVLRKARLLFRQESGREYSDDPSRFFFLRSSPNERVDPRHLGIEFIFYDTAAIVNGQSEDATHLIITPFFQLFLGGLLKLMNLGWSSNIRFARNEAEHKRYRTTQENLRPDWMCYIHNLLIIRGEEKGDTARASLRDAAEELTSKMGTWHPLFFGELPYVFGYALRGARFQLYALYPDPAPPVPIAGGASGVQKIPIGEELDLTQIDQKMTLLQYIINLARVLQIMESLVPRDAPPLGEAEPIWKRPGSGEYSRIVFEPGFVIKTLIFSEVGPVRYDLDMLEKLYALVKQNRFRNMIRCKEGYPRRIGEMETSMKLHLFPIGLQVYPRDTPSLRRCLCEILTALSDLHTNEFVHRDVRWPNILRNVDQSWMLIDLDFAAKLREGGIADWPTWTRGLPERVGEEPWTPRHDILQVSMLLSAIELYWYHGREQLKLDLGRCPSASAALEVVHNAFPNL